MDSAVEGTTHPLCLFTELSETPEADQLKDDLIKIIRWADKESPRSKQRALGPSEMGTACDRRLGYRMAEIPAVNVNFDPWPALVGTAMHSWLEAAVNNWCQQSTEECPWITEKRLIFGEFTTGHSDLFHKGRGIVIDHKSAGPDVMRKIRKDGPPPGYVVQVQLYGLGYENLGYKVNHVALAFYPRAGWLKDMYVWVTKYERDIANAAIARMHQVAVDVTSLSVYDNPHRWEQVPAYPSNDCGFCPWYDPGRLAERGADATGCPGR